MFITTVFIIVLAAAGPALNDQDLSITGFVVTEDGKPLEGVDVLVSHSVSYESKIFKRLKTDACGRFLLQLPKDNLAKTLNGNLSIYVHPPEYTLDLLTINPIKPPCGRPLYVVVGKQRKSSFHICDPIGNPVAGAGRRLHKIHPHNRSGPFLSG